MIDPFTRRFEISQYDNKHVISIMNLVENTLLDIYPRPTGIMYVKGSSFISVELITPLIKEEYGI